jgi:hypothetical protein
VLAFASTSFLSGVVAFLELDTDGAASLLTLTFGVALLIFDLLLDAK